MAAPTTTASWASSPQSRAVMQGNRRIDTKPEVLLRSLLHRRGLRFRKDRGLRAGELGVRPDIVFGRAKLAVFLDGCFWHYCPQHGTDPKSNVGYWSKKLTGNVARDRRNDQALPPAAGL
jgi:DNA mismatch endonuclease (patch repair protein)